MTLNIHTEEDDQRQLTMTIEVPEKRILQEMKAKARKLARDINVPGFRRGKAPYHVIANRVGKEYLRSEAIEALVQPVYEEALAEVQPDIYAQARLDKIDDDPLTLTFTIPLAPTVDLGDYRSLRQEIEPVEISEEAVDEALETLREKYMELDEVDRPAAIGDVVTIAGKGTLEATAEAEDAAAENETDEAERKEVVLFDTENLQIILDGDKLFPGTSFVENIAGMSVGDEKSFTIAFPDDYEEEELQGKEAVVNVTLLQVQERQIPLLDDNLAEMEGYNSLDDMRAGVRENLKKAAENQARNDLIEKMVADMQEMATLVYPPAAVDEEIDNRIARFKEQVEKSGWEWEDYLKIQGVTEEKLREDFQEAAVKAVETQLVLRQFVLEEKLTINEADLEAKIDERTESFSDNEELSAAMREHYKQGEALHILSSEILTEKAYERMVAILSGNAPDLAELAEDEAADEAEETAETEESAEEIAKTDEEAAVVEQE